MRKKTYSYLRLFILGISGNTKGGLLLQVSFNLEIIKIIIDIVIAGLTLTISIAAFWVSLLTYRNERKPVISLVLTAQDNWIMLSIKNSGKGEAEQMNINYTYREHINHLEIHHLPPEVNYLLKLEPFSIVENVPISERLITFDYTYINCYGKKEHRANIPIQII